MNSSIAEQVEKAKAAVRYRKEHVPYTFPEYSRLLEAQAKHQQATQELLAAKKAWRELGR